MKTFSKGSALSFALGFLVCSCSSLETMSSNSVGHLPSTFTSENLLTTHIGMKSEEIQKMYGDPKNISKSVCGSKTAGGRWNCITWEYGKSPYDNATFTFAEKEGSVRLNSFDIERRESDLPETFTTENVMKVQQGMSHRKILDLFGPPRNVGQTVCGTATAKPWICTTWEYGNSPYANARFTFTLGENSMLLNDFKVERE